MTRCLSLLWPALLATALALPARAQVPAACDAPRDADPYQLLRRLSLDLRGKVPSYEEYLALDAPGATPQALVRGWLQGDDFRLVMRRYHEELLWPNVSATRLNNVNSQLTLGASDPAWSISSAGRRKTFRGSPDVNTAQYGAVCGDFEQTHFLPGGDFKVDPVGIKSTVVGAVTVKQEGWRLVHPYWESDPAVKIKVCAFDAQETPTSTTGLSCGDANANGKAECGCGEGLRFCFGPAANTRTPIYNAMREQLLRAVDAVSTGGKPYTDLILSRGAQLNGPLAFWKKYLANNVPLTTLATLGDPGEVLPAAPDFTDATWSEVDRGTDLHAGVLTMPGYLLRFQTNRARANRFRQDFECESFVPPAVSQNEPGCSAAGTDLTKRCACQYCHSTLEPLAAHWGKFAEAGTTLMTDTTRFPVQNNSCIGSTNGICARFYATNPDGDSPGKLLAWQYADAAHPGIRDAIGPGPRARAQAILASGVFARCTVKRAFTYLMKREPRDDEQATVATLAEGFKSNAYSLPWLMETLVGRDDYRRVR
jgi:hypothetical protein